MVTEELSPMVIEAIKEQFGSNRKFSIVTGIPLPTVNRAMAGKPVSIENIGLITDGLEIYRPDTVLDILEELKGLAEQNKYSVPVRYEHLEKIDVVLKGWLR